MGKKTVSPEEWKQYAIDVAKHLAAVLEYNQQLDALISRDSGGETPPPPLPPKPPGG